SPVLWARSSSSSLLWIKKGHCPYSWLTRPCPGSYHDERLRWRVGSSQAIAATYGTGARRHAVVRGGAVCPAGCILRACAALCWLYSVPACVQSPGSREPARLCHCHVHRSGPGFSNWRGAWLERVCAAPITAALWSIAGKPHPWAAVGTLAPAVVFYKMGSGVPEHRSAVGDTLVRACRHKLHHFHDVAV